MGSTLTWRQPPERRPRRHGERVSVGRGRLRLDGYLAHSDRSGPGVLVLHESFGLQQSFIDLSDRLAGEGFTAFAPDLYGGRMAASIEEAAALADGLDPELTRRRLAEAAAHLRANWHPRLGAIGFSSGAAHATALGDEPGLDALVVYYGLGDLTGVRSGTPVLGHFATGDHHEPVDAVRAAFAGRPEAELCLYDGVGHWFANSSVGDAYDAATAEAAYGATLEFLRYHLS